MSALGESIALDRAARRLRWLLAHDNTLSPGERARMTREAAELEREAKWAYAAARDECEEGD